MYADAAIVDRLTTAARHHSHYTAAGGIAALAVNHWLYTCHQAIHCTDHKTHQDRDNDLLLQSTTQVWQVAAMWPF